MKICQINCVYGEGSTGKITRDLHLSLLKEGYDAIVITPLKNKFTTDKGVYVVSNKWLSYCSAILRRGFGMQFDWAFIQTWRIIRVLKKEKPDVVHLQCINGNDINIYMLLRFLAKNRIKTLYTLHAEFPYTGGCGNAVTCERWKTVCGSCPNLKATQSLWLDGTYRTWRKQGDSYQLFDKQLLHFTTVSPWLLSRAKESPLLENFKKTTVMNGVETNVFKYENEDGEWRRKLGVSDEEKMLLYVTASFFPHEQNLKGGRFVVQLANRLKDRAIKIVVAANYGEAENIPDNIIYIGRTKTQVDLASLYREADLTMITSSSETFGMPVAESLCCGTPVVGFKAGGPESIALQEYSEFVSYGDIDALYDCIIRWINKPHDHMTIATSATAKYSKEVMTEGYINQYKMFLSE